MDVYNIYCRGRKIYSKVSENEMLDILAGFADDFHSTGEPDPEEISVELLENDGRTRYLTKPPKV